MSGTERSVQVVGAGIFGLWQALTLARAGYRVELVEESDQPFEAAQSRYAGAMLSPYCEEEGAHALVRDLGLRGIELWQSSYPGIVQSGTLVVANVRDLGELTRFARATRGHRQLNGGGLSELEPDLGGRFTSGLFYADEAHMATPAALAYLFDAVGKAGCTVRLGVHWDGVVDPKLDAVVDCRGIGAQRDVPRLRGVRGERLVIRSHDVQLGRPVRLLHPRHPLYVVPWGDGLFMVGATVIESEDTGPVTVRSALELMGLAYALHPAFGEAEIVDIGAGLRPSLPDNLPRAVVENRLVRVNGAYRHGFLLAPVLAEAVCAFLDDPAHKHPLLTLQYP